MKLIEYLVERDLRPAAFARLIEVKSDMTVIRYIREERIPAPEIMKRIETITEGLVSRVDFPETPKSANDDMEHAWSRLADYEEKRVNRLMKAMLKRPKEGDTLSPPLRRAVDTLENRVTMNTDRTKFWLDGRPTRTFAIVKVANQTLEERGLPLIYYPIVNPKAK